MKTLYIVVSGLMAADLAGLVVLAAARPQKPTDADVRVQLAQTQAALAAATNDRSALAASIARANTDSAARTAALSKAAISGRVTASDVAQSNAAAAQSTATSNAAIAQQAADRAVVEAATIKVQLGEFQKVADRENFTLMLTQLFGFFSVLLGFLYKAWTESRDRRWARQDADLAKGELVAHQKEMLTKLGEVKDEAHNAYKEANTVNLKIASIGLKVADNQPLSPNEPHA